MKIKSLISSYSIYLVCEKLAVVCIWNFLCVLEFQVERSSVTFADIGGCQTAIEVCHYVIMMSSISSLCSVLCPRFSLSGGPETSPPHEAPGGVFSSRDLPPTGGSPPRTPRLREDIASLRHCWGNETSSHSTGCHGDSKWSLRRIRGLSQRPVLAGQG
jgi:hypothetical protein